MENIVTKIYHQKLNEIQSRIPVKLFARKNAAGGFAQVLSAAEKTAGTNGQAVSVVRSSYPVSADSAGSGSFDELIESVSRKYGVDSTLVRAVIQAESNFNPSAVSSAGALGLMQLMPATAAGLGVLNPLDPTQNIDGGVRLLKQLLTQYNGDIKMALAAYNCGSGTLARQGIKNLDSAGTMDKLYRETRNYVNKIMGYIGADV